MPLRGASRAIRHWRTTECAPRPDVVGARGCPIRGLRVATSRPVLSRAGGSPSTAHSDCERSERGVQGSSKVDAAAVERTTVDEVVEGCAHRRGRRTRSLRSQSLCAMTRGRARTIRSRPRGTQPEGRAVREPRAGTSSGRGAHSGARLCLIARLRRATAPTRSLRLRGYGPPTAGLRSHRPSSLRFAIDLANEPLAVVDGGQWAMGYVAQARRRRAVASEPKAP